MTTEKETQLIAILSFLGLKESISIKLRGNLENAHGIPDEFIELSRSQKYKHVHYDMELAAGVYMAYDIYDYEKECDLDTELMLNQITVEGPVHDCYIEEMIKWHYYRECCGKAYHIVFEKWLKTISKSEVDAYLLQNQIKLTN